MNNRKLVLENGAVYEGMGFGSLNEVVSEIIFNTSVVGYQEILSDPTNCSKMICMTYPLIGNYGLTDEDYESKHLSVKGMIVREYNELPSNFRYTKTLGEVMEENNISGITGVDTRSITKAVRDNGSMKGLICDINKPLEECLEVIKNYTEEENLVNLVSSKKVWYSRTPNPMFNIAVIDLGIKLSFLKQLNKLGGNVIVFPYNVTKEEILKYRPNGLFISNGPGDPSKLDEVVKIIKSFIGELPIFGVGLGCQLIAKCYEVESNKMKCGKYGCNYPVKNVATGKVEITTQNNLYSLNKEQLENSKLTTTHINVIGNEVVGIKDEENQVMAILFEPAKPIDKDGEDMSLEFLNLIKNSGGKKNA